MLGYAMVVAEDFDVYRDGFDLVHPVSQRTFAPDELWRVTPALLPMKRQYLASIWGNLRTSNSQNRLMGELKQLETSSTGGVFNFTFSCTPLGDHGQTSDVCGSENERSALLRQSTFALIPPPVDGVRSSHALLTRLMEALHSGAVPVLLDEASVLPLADFIDWRKCLLRVRPSRIGELHFLLRAINAADFLEMRRHGQRVFQTYFATDNALVESIIAALRTRIGVPATAVTAVAATPLISNTSWYPSNTIDVPNEDEEYLGPVETAQPSLSFQQNFTLLQMHRYRLWNDYFNPFRLHPEFPDLLPVMPTEAKFHADTDVGFRPIGLGVGGSGREFSASIGGNVPREQFTVRSHDSVVILTYKREAVLSDSLQRLYRLPYLNKILVVWNGPDPPTPEQTWPKLNVPVLFIKRKENSLNNRFLPFGDIETEAVLSLDDDVRLTQAEIVLAFRVWRENRDVIVGFPGRFHSWDAKPRHWIYNSNHSCELSMVLTGAAFINRYYLDAYTNKMPAAIRDKVDELTNCEDLAMNMLVAHLTRKPPLKVTTKWTFKCNGCPDTLTADVTHFDERHGCLQFFTRVFGYNPLLNRQYRADSVLFKTRLPHQHQHCFKFI